jgi:DNA-binding transcriptional ArsR family regulator
VEPTRDQDQCANILRALGEPLRLRILGHLAAGPCSIGAVADALDIPHYQASRHLAALAEIGVVTQVKRGRTVTCSLTTKAPVLDLGCCTLRLDPTSGHPG